MIDLVLSYFKGISSYLDELLAKITFDIISNGKELKHDQIEESIRFHLNSITSDNILVSIFGLKTVEECEKEIDS